MRAGLPILLQVLRHAVLGVAVMAVLLSAFGVHSHAVETDNAIGCCLDDLPADPELDGDDHCHCPPPAAMAGDTTALSCSASVATVSRTCHHGNLPDSLSYPPDPPPVRLN
jgi:hypothetical protein